MNRIGRRTEEFVCIKEMQHYLKFSIVFTQINELKKASNQLNKVKRLLNREKMKKYMKRN